MSKPDHTPIPRYRSFSGATLLSQGFRPFFLLAGLWAAVILPLSVEMIQGHIGFPFNGDPMAWHFHEMLFGFVVAVITGFLLTAIPNWTGRLPLQGWPLFGLVLLWVAGRTAFALSGVIGAVPAAVVDGAYLPVLVAVTLREIVSGRNWRNVPIILILVVLFIGNALFHAQLIGWVGPNGYGERVAIAAVVVLIALIGGRVVPSFTRNWLMKAQSPKLPAPFGPYDRLTLVFTGIALLFWVLEPSGQATALVVGVAGVLNLGRVARWRGLATLSEPLLWVLHVGYLWIAVGLFLLSFSHFVSGLGQSDALHALTAGAMGTMTLAMMTRATLGHTGRPLNAGKGLAAAYILVVVSAVLRLLAPLWGDLYTPVLGAAMAAWVAGFVLYVIIFAPMLLKRRTL